MTLPVNRIRARLRELGIGIKTILDAEARTRYGKDFAELLHEDPHAARHIARKVLGPAQAQTVLALITAPANRRANQEQRHRETAIIIV